MFSKEESKILKQEFWEGFGRYTKFYSQKVGMPIKWMLYKTEIKGLELKFDVSKNFILVVLELNHANDDKRREMFLELEMYKSILVEGIDSDVFFVKDYELEDGKLVSRLYMEESRFNFFNRDHWSEIYRFMAKNMYQLQLNFEDIHDIFKDKFRLVF